MPRTRLFMETTKVSASESAADITASLVSHGAKSINTDYEGGKIVGLRWIMRVSGQDVLFDMPARVEPVYDRLKREYRGRDKPDEDAASGETMIGQAEEVLCAG